MTSAAGNTATGRRDLQSILATARKFGHRSYECQSRLGLAELEWKSGSASSRADLSVLETEARAKELLLVANQARALLETSKQSAASAEQLRRERQKCLRGSFADLSFAVAAQKQRGPRSSFATRCAKTSPVFQRTKFSGDTSSNETLWLTICLTATDISSRRSMHRQGSGVCIYGRPRKIDAHSSSFSSR